MQKMSTGLTSSAVLVFLGKFSGFIMNFLLILIMLADSIRDINQAFSFKRDRDGNTMMLNVLLVIQ